MRLWSQLIRSDVKAVVFLFDEADQLQNIEGGWRFLKSVFTRISEAEGKFMLAVAGSLDFSKNVPSGTSLSEVVGSSPIERYLQPVILKEMTAEEIGDVLSKAIHPHESMISSATAGLIYELSGGNLYLAQNIALVTIGHFPGSSEITPRMVNAAIQDNSGNLAKLFSDRLEGRSEDEKKILLGLSHWKDSVSSRQVGLKLKLSDRSTVSAILRQLVLDGLVREPSESKFKLFSPLFASFLIGDLKVGNCEA